MSETKKIPDEALVAAAAWWAKALENPKFDALGGERDHSMEFAQVLMSVNAARNRPSQASLDQFRGALVIALSGDKAERGHIYLGTDYHPDAILADAARAAGMTSDFPIKTSMWIEPTEVVVRYGYGAEPQTVWSAEALANVG